MRKVFTILTVVALIFSIVATGVIVVIDSVGSQDPEAITQSEETVSPNSWNAE